MQFVVKNGIIKTALFIYCATHVANRTAYILIVLFTAITTCHNDLRAVKGSKQLFKLLDQFRAVQRLMFFSALTAELADIEVWRKLSVIIEIVTLTSP